MNTNYIINVNYFLNHIVIFFIALCILNHKSYAGIPPGAKEGMCWTEPLFLQSVIMDDAGFSSSNKGSTGFLYAQGEPTTGYCFTTTPPLAVSYNYAEIPAQYPKSSLNNGYYKLNEDVDFFLESFGLRTPLEYNNTETKESSPVMTGDTGITPILPYVTAGKHVNIHFILRRNIIGGGIVVPSGTIIGNLYVYSNSGERSTTPYMTLKMGGVVITPTLCNINNGDIIDVNFGNIDSSRLTTSSSTATLSIDKQLIYSCSSALNQNINVRLVATTSEFDDNAIKTSNKDVGIIILHNGKPVPPEGIGFPTTLKDGKGSDTVTFVPVKSSSAKIASGAFSACATLIITAA